MKSINTNCVIITSNMTGQTSKPLTYRWKSDLIIIVVKCLLTLICAVYENYMQLNVI